MFVYLNTKIDLLDETLNFIKKNLQYLELSAAHREHQGDLLGAVVPIYEVLSNSRYIDLN